MYTNKYRAMAKSAFVRQYVEVEIQEIKDTTDEEEEKIEE